MDTSGEQPKFGVEQTIEQKPFKNPAVQSFFTTWCTINDSIQPRIIDRNNWDQRRERGILEKRQHGKQTLYIPEDLQLWEMVGVMEAVDKDTFAAKPERQGESKEKLLKLGKTFKNAGIYIAKRLDSVTQGKEIASALASEFYDYGQSLIDGKKPEQSEDVQGIASHSLTPTETEEIDRFLAGDNPYLSRQARVEKTLRQSSGPGTSTDPAPKEEFYEAERHRTLAQFLRVSQKAFEMDRRGEGEGQPDIKSTLKTWQNDAPIHRTFLEKIEKAMAREIEKPKTEFNSAIFRRGLENLVNEMKIPKLKPKHGINSLVNSLFGKLGINLRDEQRKIADVLSLTETRTSMEDIRQRGDADLISSLERQLADVIQLAVSSFPQKSHAHNPSEMLATQFINCVGASMLGGALMKEAGLHYLVGGIPGHSILFLITQDGRVELRDMLRSPSFNEEITDDDIQGQNDGLPLTVADIAAFSRDPKPEGLIFQIRNETYQTKFSYIGEEIRQNINVFEPEYGQQLQLLNNTGFSLQRLGKYETAIEAYQQAVAIYPKSDRIYWLMGNTFLELGRNEEGFKAYSQAIKINPSFAPAYVSLGARLLSLGRKQEAIKAFQTCIRLADKQRDGKWINLAEEGIKM